MDFKSFAKLNAQDALLFAKKVLRNITLTLLLFSFALPLSHNIINTKAQDSNQPNSKTKITVEIVKKNQERETKAMTLSQLQTDSELADVNKVDSLLKKISLEQTTIDTSLNLTPQLIQEIETKGGVITDANGVSKVDHTVLAALGLTSQQIDEIENGANIYNAQPIKSISVSYEPERKVSQSNYFTLQAHAGCNYEYTTSFHYWGVRTWVNNCLIQDIKVYGFIGAGSSALAGGLPGQIVGFVMGTYIELIDAANSRCDNRGAYIDKPFIGKFYVINNVC